MWRAVREWYIVGIGVLLIAGGLALAAHQSSPPAAVNQAAGTAPDQTTPAPKTATRTAQQAAPGTASGIPAPRVTAAAVPAGQSPVSTAPAAPAVAAAPQTTAPSPAPLSHDHAAASAASETSAQAPPTPSASPASGGDPVAGRLVFRKCQACHSLEPGKNILGPSLAGIVGRKVRAGELLREIAERKERHAGKACQGVARCYPTEVPKLSDLGVTKTRWHVNCHPVLFGMFPICFA